MSYTTVLDLFGTFVFAISGSLLAYRKKLDIFGFFIIGFVTSVGGGSLRDVLIGNVPVFWLKDIRYVIIVFAATLVTFSLPQFFAKLKYPLIIADALGIAVFTIMGIRVGMAHELGSLFALMMGVTSAILGGVIRDILCNEIPLVLQKEIYATACIVGGCVYLFCESLHVHEMLQTTLSILVIITVRLVSVMLHLSLPKRTWKS